MCLEANMDMTEERETVRSNKFEVPLGQAPPRKHSVKTRNTPRCISAFTRSSRTSFSMLKNVGA